MTNLENNEAITNLRISSHKLRSVLGKWYSNMKDIALYRERNTFFLFECRNHDALRNDTFKRIKEIKEIDLQTKD